MNEIQNEETQSTNKKRKRGIIYLSSIPQYMNVTRIREVFLEYGAIGRVFLQLSDTIDQKTKRKKVAKKFSEGWVEFEKKSVAKKVALHLNNKQVSTRKKSKHFDCIWNIKYLSGFKWVHLHERLAYEKAVRRQKLRAEITLAKKKTTYFTTNLRKHKSDVKTETQSVENSTQSETNKLEATEGDRQDFLKSIFT